MEIRLAHKDDLKEIIKIESICFPPSEAASKEVMKERFKAFGENFLVAVEDEKIVGFINGCTTAKACLPDKLYNDVTLHNPK
ncbi:GNAT family N-acetyltransferase, partial [Clostridium perfringens]|nr:GNAT family N-acetyltransferase [Clostridium perfringens]